MRSRFGSRAGPLCRCRMSLVELRRERYTAEFLDPRRGFEATSLPLEFRWDPLTGQSCRVLPAGSLPRPEQQDLDALAVETRPTCPFCAERVETATPRFPPELCAEGRVPLRRSGALPQPCSV